jgi:RNA polymerase sigma-70 factor, ECF subfamily
MPNGPWILVEAMFYQKAGTKSADTACRFRDSTLKFKGRTVEDAMWPESEKTEQLLADARVGDVQAVDRLLDRHRAAVHRMVRMRLDRKIQRRVDVSDVVQDVLVEANRRLQDYLENPGMAFHLWIRQITRDRIIDAHRRHRASAKRSVDREQGLALQGEDSSSMILAARLCDPGLTPAAAATRREMARQVEQAITQLTGSDYEVIVMRHYEQLSNQEVAQTLGLSEAAASMRYLRAIRRLRSLLGEPSEETAKRTVPS